MPRMPRVHLTGILYYVTQQGAHDRLLFRDAEDNQAYLDLLKQYKTKHQFHLFSYALLSDKINLIIEPYGSATISEIMRDLTSRYSKYYNGRYGAEGSLFKGRFHTVMAEKETYLPRLIRYVNHLAPQQLSFATSFATYAQFANGENSVGLLGDEMKEIARMPQFSGTDALKQLSMALPEAEASHLTQQLKSAIVGSSAFIQKIRTEMKETASQTHETVLEAQRETSTAGSAAPWSFAYTGMKGKVWFTAFWAVPVLAAAVAFTVIPKYVALNQAHPETKSVSIAAQPENAAVNQNNILHASVVVLEGTEWNVKLIPMGSKDKTTIDFDRIRFSNDQVASKNMAARGFQPTYYTVTTNPDGSIVWETMQTGPSGEIVAWRGESNEGQMRGVISQQLTSGETKTFHFVGSR